MPARRSSPDITNRPPPPDPLDAAEEALARARRAADELADVDDFDEPTGRVDTPAFHIHLDADGTGRHVPQTSFHDDDVPKKSPLGAWLAVIGTLATIAAAVAHALGLV